MAGSRRALRALTPALLVPVLLGACGRSEAPRVDLDAREPVAYPDRHPPGAPLRFVLGGALVPREGFHHYKALLALVERRIGRPIKAVERSGFAAVNEAISRGEVDAAFLGSGPYAAGADAGAVELLAVPVVGGATDYASCLIVPASGPATVLADLRGRSFAFVDPLSLTGCLHPLAEVAALGADPAAFFGRVVFTGAHDASVRAVAGGLVDGAAVDNYLLEAVRRERPDLAARVRVIATSGPFPGPPAVVRRGLDPGVAARLREAFLGLDRDEEGRAALRAIGVVRFAAADDAGYASVRRLRERFGPTAAALAARRSS